MAAAGIVNQSEKKNNTDQLDYEKDLPKSNENDSKDYKTDQTIVSPSGKNRNQKIAKQLWAGILVNTKEPLKMERFL